VTISQAELNGKNTSDPDVDTEGSPEPSESATAGVIPDEMDAGETIDDDVVPTKSSHRIKWSHVVVFGLLPALALVIGLGAAYLKWRVVSVRDTDIARAESVQAARDSTIALLSYQPDNVDHQLKAAQNLLTGQFRESYSSLIRDVVIPGAQQQHISAAASVPVAASVSATPDHAVALVFVDQTVIVGNDAPTGTASSVRVTLDKVGGHWLISGFDPI
jgi:Mce-associated membrane protein